jgi:hypothetical protein
LAAKADVNLAALPDVSLEIKQINENICKVSRKVKNHK